MLWGLPVLIPEGTYVADSIWMRVRAHEAASGNNLNHGARCRPSFSPNPKG